MTITSAIRYKGYVLDCEPLKKDETCFIAQVIISRESGAVLSEFAFPDLCFTKSAPVVVTIAKAWGRHWVDENSE